MKCGKPLDESTLHPFRIVKFYLRKFVINVGTIKLKI